MKNIKPILAWILVIVMVCTNINYVKADTISEDDLEVVAKGSDEPEVSIEAATEDKDVSDGEVSEDIREKMTDEMIEENLISDEENREVKSTGDIIASGIFRGMDWVIDGDGMLIISGEYEYKGSDKENPEWINYSSSIKSAKITARGVQSTYRWFYYCYDLTSVDVSGWDTGSVKDMSGMFYWCSALTSVDVSGWDTGSVKDMSYMFYECYNLTSVDMSGWDTGSVMSMWFMFSECRALTSVDVSGWDTGSVTNMSHMFYNCRALTSVDVSGWDTGSVKDMSGMFYWCRALTSVDVGGWDTGSVTDMDDMFYWCSALTSVDVSGWDTGSVTNMSGMFSVCSALTSADVSGWDTGSVTNMGSMFDGCSALTSVDVSDWDTGSVKDMSYMFYECYNLTSVDVSGWSTGSVTDMRGMFWCSALTSVDVSGWDTSSVKDMSYMFYKCSDLTSVDVSGWDTGSVTDMRSMFYNCSNIQQIKTFPNLQQQLELPLSPMYDEYGDEYTYFPTGLLEGIWLYASQSAKPDIDTSCSTTITVYDEKLKTPLSDVIVAINNQCYKTGLDGKIQFNGNSTNYSAVTFSKTGYATKTITLNLSNQNNRVYLTPEYSFQICPPGVSADVKLKDSINVGGKDITWLDFDYKLDIKGINTGRQGVSSSIPIKIDPDPEKQTVKVSFGIKEDDKTGEVNGGTYKTVKNLCSIVGMPGANQKIQDYINKHGSKAESDFGVKVSSSIIGYFEYDLQNQRILESGAIIGLSGEGTLTYRPAITGGIGYFKAILKLSGEGKLILEFQDDDVNFRATLDFKQALKIAGGIGGDSIHGEIGAEGTLSEKLELPFKSARESLEIKANAKIYAELKLFLFNVSTDYKSPDLMLWPAGSKSRSITYALESGSLYEPTEMTLASRDYSFLAASPLEDAFVMENVYPDGTPQMCRLSDGTLLAVWITDDGSKSDENRTTLVYSVNKGNGWSAVQPVYETGRADFEPSLAVYGDKAILTYFNIGAEMESGANLDELLANIDLYITTFENGSFSTPELLTESGNGVMEFSARTAYSGDRTAVVWIENSNNDPFLMDGTNSLYLSIYENGEWTKQCILEDLPLVPSVDVAFAGDELYVAYTLDLDNDMETTEDTELFLWNEGTATRLTSDAKADASVRFVDDMLYWISNGEIMQMKTGVIGSTQSTGIADVSTYEVLENKTGKAILFIGRDGFRSELYLSEQKNGVFEAPIPVTDYGNHISDFAAVYQNDGELTALIFERKVLDTDDAVYGTTDLHMSEGLSAHNLILEDAWYDMDSMTSAGELPFGITVCNAGSEAVNSLQVSLMAGQEALYTNTVSCDLAAGEETMLSVNFPVKATDMGQDITVQVLPVDWEDSRLEDNVLELALGLADVVLEDFAISYQDGESVLTGKIRNEGYQTAENVQFTVLEGGADGAQIYQQNCGALAAGAEYDISYTIPDSSLGFTDAFDVKYFHVLCDTDTVEEAYGNNSENLAAFPVKVTGLELDAKTLEMTANSSSKLNATVFPENAIDKKVYYTSDSHEVAIVLEDGTIIAGKEGTALITAITADEDFTQTCEVTVTAHGEDVPEYHMNIRWAELEVGDTQQLSVLDAEEQKVSDVKWSSSNPSIASVDADGLVEAQAPGTVYITVSTNDGSYHNACVIHVISKELQALVFEQSLCELTEGETLLQMLPAFYPADTTTDKTLKWTSSNEEVASVSQEGLVKAVGAGTAAITATSVNNVTAQYQVRVNALPRYTVTFDSDLGDEPVQVTDILGGTKITLPEQPVREGYTFKGWYTERNGQGTQFTEETMVTEDLYLYAYWTMISSSGPSVEGNDGFWVSEVAPQTYTGSAIKPAVMVYDGLTLLTEKVDYTVSYKNNTKVNDATVEKTAPTIIITGKGNYTGKETVTFSIVAKSIGDEDISVADIFAGQTGKVQKPVPTVTWQNKKLTNKKDFVVSYPDLEDSSGTNAGNTDAYKNVGDYRVIITGINNFAGEREITFHITTATLMSKVKVKAIPKQTYTGSAIKPDLTVTYGKTTLNLGTDYTVSYQNNTQAGKATAVLTGKGDYAGTKEVSFQIVGTPIAKATVNGLTDKVYNGQEQTQNIQVQLDGKTLTRNNDYQVSYTKNLNAGTATMTITGIGGYSGTLKKKFKITAYDLSADESRLMGGFPKDGMNVAYTKGGSTPEVSLSFHGVELTVKKDYTVSYSNNKKVTGEGDTKTPTITIKGKGNFKGTKTISFNITKRNLNAAGNPVTIHVPDMPYVNKAGKYISKPVLTDINGKKLSAGTDYEKTITYTLVSGGTADSNTTDASGNITAEAVLDTDIVARSEAVQSDTTLDKTSIPTVGSVIKVTITGKGNYEGTMEATYRIAPASFSSAKITIEPQIYTGSPIILAEKDITVKQGKDTFLTYGKDYEIVEGSYQNNVKKGTASVMIKGIGDYAGTKTVKFKITSKKLVWFWKFFQ